MEALRINHDVQLDRAVKMYVSKVERDSGYKLINRNITYNDFLKNRMLLVHAIREGVSFDLFNLIKDKTPFNDEDWASS
jgi:fibronectin type 3 domain-containing protein